MKEDQNCFNPNGAEVNYMKETLNKGGLSTCNHFFKTERGETETKHFHNSAFRNVLCVILQSIQVN